MQRVIVAVCDDQCYDDCVNDMSQETCSDCTVVTNDGAEMNYDVCDSSIANHNGVSSYMFDDTSGVLFLVIFSAFPKDARER